MFGSTSQSSEPAFNGWRIVRGGFAIQALHSGLVFNAFALIAVELRDEFGWSAGALGAAFALNRAESGLLGPIQGWMTDHWGPRVVLRVGAVIMAIGLVAFATLDSLLEFYAFYLLVSLGSSLAGFLGITVAIVNWFERKRSRALALAQMGFAVGGAFTFLVGLALHQFGCENNIGAVGRSNACGDPAPVPPLRQAARRRRPIRRRNRPRLCRR